MTNELENLMKVSLDLASLIESGGVIGDLCVRRAVIELRRAIRESRVNLTCPPVEQPPAGPDPTKGIGNLKQCEQCDRTVVAWRSPGETVMGTKYPQPADYRPKPEASPAPPFKCGCSPDCDRNLRTPTPPTVLWPYYCHKCTQSGFVRCANPGAYGHGPTPPAPPSGPPVATAPSAEPYVSPFRKVVEECAGELAESLTWEDDNVKGAEWARKMGHACIEAAKDEMRVEFSAKLEELHARLSVLEEVGRARNDYAWEKRNDYQWEKK